LKELDAQDTALRFASFLSGGFITAIVVNPPERKLANAYLGDYCIIHELTVD
jgi:hypothetical protein